MSWWKYVVKVSGTESPGLMESKTEIPGPNFSKWKRGHVPKPEMVATFARAYKRPVLEAFVAAEFLTPAEAKVRPKSEPDFSRLSNRRLLELVEERMREEGGGEHAERSAPNTPADSGPQLELVEQAAAATTDEMTGEVGKSDFSE